MNKKELIQSAAAHSGMSQGEVEKALNSILESIGQSLKKGEPVTLVGFGTFQVKERAERNGYNPSTGSTMLIPAKKMIKFKVSSALVVDSK